MEGSFYIPNPTTPYTSMDMKQLNNKNSTLPDPWDTRFQFLVAESFRLSISNLSSIAQPPPNDAPKPLQKLFY